jgi:hypothetical protein
MAALQMLARISGPAWLPSLNRRKTTPRPERTIGTTAASALDVQLCSTQQQLLGLQLDSAADAATITAACMHSLWLHRQAPPEGAAAEVEQQLLDVLVQLVGEQARSSSPKDVIEQAWALSQHPLQLPTSHSLAEVLMETTSHHLASGKVSHPTELLLLLQAAHSLSVTPSSVWWDAWQGSMAPHMRHLSGSALTQCMWWARYLDLPPSTQFLPQWLGATQEHLQRAAAATTTTGSSTSSSSSSSSTGSSVSHTSSTDTQLSAQQVQRMLLALADLGVPGPLPHTWTAAWGAAMQPLLCDLDLEQLSLCIWAAAVMQVHLSAAWADAFQGALQQALRLAGPVRLVALAPATPSVIRHQSPMGHPCVEAGTHITLQAGDRVVTAGCVMRWVPLPVTTQAPPAVGDALQSSTCTASKESLATQGIAGVDHEHAAGQGHAYLAQVQLQDAECDGEHASAYRRLLVAFVSLGWFQHRH